MKKKLGTTLVALATVLAFTACDEIAAAECEECPTCPAEEEPGEPGTGGQEVTHKDHTITFDGNEYVYVFDLPEEANKDEEVSFKLLTESGYVASNVSVTYKGTELREVVPEEPEEPLEEESSEDESLDDTEEEKEPEYEEVEVDIEVELTGSASTGYSFIMPDKDVTVHAEGLGAYFNCWYDTNLEVFTSYNGDSRKMSTFWEGIYEPGTGNGISTGANNYIQAGREILIVAGRTYTEQNIQLLADGEPLEEVTDPEINPNEYFAFAFTMPNHDVEITATMSSRYLNVSLDTENAYDDQGDPILDAYLYMSGDETNHTQRLEGLKAVSDQPYIYAKIKDEYAEDYLLDSVTISWNRYTSNKVNTTSENSATTSWSSTSTSMGTSGAAARIDDNTKRFQIPSAYYSDNEITVSFSIKDVTKYKGYSFVGTWTTMEWYNQSRRTSTYTTTVDGSGSFSSTSSYLGGMYVTSVAEDNLSCTLSDGRIFYNDGKVAVMEYLSSTSYTNDVWILAKDITGSMVWDTWSQSNYIWVVRVSDSDGNLLGTVCSTGQDKSCLYAGATVEFNDGATTVAQSTNFTVKDANGNTLLSVTPEPAG